MDTTIFDRHERIALQFSGGKDSSVCLHLMREYWDRMTVYWLNAGDEFPETHEIVNHWRVQVPHFVEITRDVHGVIAEHGLPSDLVPCNSTLLGQIIEPNGLALQDRYECCFRTVMQPLQARMVTDGITCIIRGQKNADQGKGPLRSGDTQRGIEVCYPVEGWTHEQVYQYHLDHALPLSRVYTRMNTTPECMTCSAWWDDGRAAYMREFHPEQHRKYQSRLDQIRVVVQPVVDMFNREYGDGV